YMKQFQVLTLAFFLLIICFVIPVVKAQKAKAPRDGDQQQTTLMQYIEMLGDRFDCFFTLEEGFNKDEPTANFDQRYIEKFGLHRQAHEESSYVEVRLEELKQAVPHFDFQINTSNPRIIHIIDARLNQRKNYPFTRSSSFSKLTNLPMRS